MQKPVFYKAVYANQACKYKFGKIFGLFGELTGYIGCMAQLLLLFTVKDIYEIIRQRAPLSCAIYPVSIQWRR